LERRERQQRELTEPPTDALPAFPRSRRAVRAGLDLAEQQRTEAWKPPSASARRSDGARNEAPPRRVFSPQPRYPPDLLAARVTGLVKLRVHVARDGRVKRAAIHRSSGRRALDQAALEAVRRWRFEPARRAGIAISREVIVPIRFTIQD
jgi:protein TonB